MRKKVKRAFFLCNGIVSLQFIVNSSHILQFHLEEGKEKHFSH